MAGSDHWHDRCFESLIDPTARESAFFYRKHIALISNFFSAGHGAGITGVTVEPLRPSRGDDPVPKGPTRSVFGSPLITFLVLAAPAVWTGVLVFLYGVDTPWGDQWDGTLPLLEKMQAGTLGFADLFAFHNEHCIFFPRLITLGLAKLTHWNIRAELLVIWILACVCSVSLWRVALRTGWQDSRNRGWLLFAANVLLFTPLQWENLLWGFQIGFFLPLACLTASLWAALSLRRPWCFVFTLIPCLVSTFSVASGFSAWLLTAPLLLVSQSEARARGRKIWWLVWLFVGAISVYFYFHGYARPATHPSVWEPLKHPLRATHFALAYLGTPFSGTAPNASAVAPVASAVLVLLFAACLVYLWRWRRDRTLLAHGLPWVSLAASSLLSAFLTMVGRLGFGVSAATQSRYVSFAIMLPIGLLFLVSLVFKHWRAQSDMGAGAIGVKSGLVVLAAALSVLFVSGTIRSLESWGRFQHSRLSGKAGLLLINVVDEPRDLARNVHPTEPALKAHTNFLGRLGYLRPRLVRSNRIQEIAFRADAETMGEFNELVKRTGGEFAASGWAILPESHRTADGVLLTYDDAQGEPIIFALAEVGFKRPEVSQRLNDKAYLRSGWMKPWKEGQIPASARVVRAWTFDAENCRAFQIGAASLEPPNAVQ
jgi:hypothetical protein